MGESAASFYRPVRVYRTLCNRCGMVSVGCRYSHFGNPMERLSPAPGGAFVWRPSPSVECPAPTLGRGASGAPCPDLAHGRGSGYYNRVIMKTLIGALTVGTILVGVSALAADAKHLRQPKHDAPERLRMIRECMGMHHKHGGDMPFHSGGNERLYRACMATRGHHG